MNAKARSDAEIELLAVDLRRRFGQLQLPPAPSRLRRRIDALAAGGSEVRVGPLRLALRARARRSWGAGLAAAGIAILALVAVGAPLLSPRGGASGSEPSNSSVPSASTSSPSSSIAPSATVRPARILSSAPDGSAILDDGPSVSWRTIDLARVDPGEQLGLPLGIARMGDKIVLGISVVTATLSDGETWDTPRLFESGDGSSWTPLPIDGEPFAHIRLTRLVGTGDGLLVIGRYAVGPGDQECTAFASADDPIGCSRTWAILTSPDGRTWHASTDPFGRDLQQISVVAGPKGILAWGPGWGDANNGSLTQPLKLFHSNDGISWAASEIPGAFMEVQPDGQGGTLTTYDEPLVQATNYGFAVVSTDKYTPRASSATWFSADGVRWSGAGTVPGRVALFSSVGGGAGGLAIAAADGSWYQGTPKSEDWRLVGVASSLPSSGWLGSDGDRIVLVGGPYVDWSSDGLTWHRGTSSPVIPSDKRGIIGSCSTIDDSAAWLSGSFVAAMSGDCATLYLGRVAEHRRD
jgi:hypothetical protein